ncbi:MAG: MFS transporter [Spirochaetales bacterium]|nr:MFS transporter [Spirochaetales bacterium]
MNSKERTGRLPVRTKLGFGVADLGGNLFFTAMGFWSLNYLTDTVAIPAAAAGAAVMIGKLWDAVTDPTMGYISDRTRTRWGRRRPYLLFGSIPLFLSMWFFFTNPHIDNVALATVWAAFALCLLNTAYTVVNIPYSSLTPELTQDYHERSSLNGYRFGFAVIGTILGAGAVLPIIGLFETRDAGFSAVGALLGVVMAVTALITFASVREPDHSATPRPTEGFFATFLAVFNNKPYVIILLTYALNLTALNFVQGILVYYFKYLYRDEGATTIAMILLLVVAMLFIPVSVLVSRHIGKKRTYQVSFFVLATACLAIFFLGHVLGMGFFLAMMVYAGIGIGFGYVAPWAMVPDTIEYDAVRTGKRKEGAFYGMWTFTSKVGTSLAIFLTGVILDLARYSPNLAEQADSATLAIRLIVGPIPAVVFIAAIILVQFYPIDEKSYATMMAEAGKKD